MIHALGIALLIVGILKLVVAFFPNKNIAITWQPVAAIINLLIAALDIAAGIVLLGGLS